MPRPIFEAHTVGTMRFDSELLKGNTATVVLAILNATLSSIYTAAVYLYAAEGTSGAMFKADQIQGAFRAK